MGAITTITRASLAAVLLGAAASIANAIGTRDDASNHAIVVTERSGEVAITANGSAHSAGAGSTLALPSRIATGADGFVALVQDQTRISIAPQSDVEIPADAAEGHLVARLVQRSGNVFYDVQKREAGKLRVETPFLVAVIKGTQFNVAVQGDSTTISLFEGRLEIHTPDDSEIIQLNAGQIAIRSMIDDSIRVIGMNDQALALPPVNDAARVAAARDAVAAAATLVAGSAEIGPAAATDVRAGTAVASPASSTLNVRATNDLRASALSVDTVHSIGSGGSADIGAPASLVGGTSLGVGTELTASTALGASADLGASLGAGVDLGGSTLDVAADTQLDLGGGGAQLGADAGLDVGGSTVVVDASLDAGADLGGSAIVIDASLDTGAALGGTAAIDAGLDTGVDLSGSGLAVDAGLVAGADLGGATADVGLDTGVDLGGTGPALDLGLDAGVGLGGTGIDTSVDASVDLGSGTVDASLGLGDTSIEVGLSPDTGLDVDTGIDVVDDLTDGLLGDGGLLGGGDSGTDDGGKSGGGGLGGLLGGLL